MRDTKQERQMIREVAVKTAQRVVKPKATEIDATGEFPRDLVEAFGKQGLLSVLLPEEYGGTQGDLSSFCLVVEEIAKVSGSSALLILAQGMGSIPILLGGNVSQQERCFSQIAEENKLTALALDEGETGSEMVSLRTRAEKQGKEYLLKGRKSFVTFGSVADFYSVFAVTEPKQGLEGFSAFMIGKETAGLHFGGREEALGMKGVVTTDVILEGCRVPAENRLGEVGKGWEIIRRTHHMSGPAAGALAVGIAQGALDFSMGYSQERVQFGKPISSFQAIRFMLADMATQVEAARALVDKAVAHFEAQHEDIETLSPMAKTYASDVAIKVTTDAVQILGGYGYMRDYPVERMMRDAKVTQIYGGTNQWERQVVAQHLFRD